MNSDGLRPLVEELDVEMTRLAARGNVGGDTVALLASWGRLIEYLALGPPHELRNCPFCGASGMRAATLCSHCWRKLEPPAPVVSA
jgi:hypothetical protein